MARFRGIPLCSGDRAGHGAAGCGIGSGVGVEMRISTPLKDGSLPRKFSELRCEQPFTLALCLPRLLKPYKKILAVIATLDVN
ncbi:hypothetical protein EPA93_41695 [Ktedonosporobacter rubrisoli]|uniref:Uncharacterized protein n=1 Tax=Ktedonosporobacter rubrisoli TaxID=2509675 RepID=A0A4P6K335_KTERU|nr:hypothetical protein [Ktedonosporobacter rubrisoli]QBD82150.1 hypothetical protein EPA93_41695 [Ktedonosporobacter rubrisoli]